MIQIGMRDSDQSEKTDTADISSTSHIVRIARLVTKTHLLVAVPSSTPRLDSNRIRAMLDSKSSRLAGIGPKDISPQHY